MQLFTDKSNARRAAKRLTAKTGRTHEVQTSSDGRYFCAIVETAPPILDEVLPAPEAEAPEAQALQTDAHGDPIFTRFYKATDGRITVFRATRRRYLSAIFSSGMRADGTEYLEAGDIRFANAKARSGSYPAEPITRIEYDQLVELKLARLAAQGGRLTYGMTPGDSWVSNAAIERAAQAAPKAEARQTPTGPVQPRAVPATAGKKAAAMQAAMRGELPTPPDFTAATHKPYRAKLATLVALAEAGDAEGLAAVAINPTSTSPKAMIRYRDLAMTAIQSRRQAA